MTSKSIGWKIDEKCRIPFLLQPAEKDYLWGGHRLKDRFAKESTLSPLAETWECSTHPDGVSMIRSGIFSGRLLSEVIRQHPEMMGTRFCTEEELPILVKLIDAQQNLSVQVHPDDTYAREYENGASGKTEMWYVLDADKNTKLICGFHYDMDEDHLRKSLEDGTIEKYLRKLPIQKGDVFCIEPGTVHAIGAGALIAEIQENSNLTYRLFDYNRLDKSGRKRELQIEKALAVANLKERKIPDQPMHMVRYRRGCASEFLYRCRYFQVEKMLLNTEQYRKMVDFQTGRDAFQVLLCIEGCGTIFWGGEVLNFFKGDCIFVPADSIPLKLHGKAQMLDIIC